METKKRNYGLEEAFGIFKPHEGEKTDFMAKFRKKQHKERMRKEKTANIILGLGSLSFTVLVIWALIKIITL